MPCIEVQLVCLMVSTFLKIQYVPLTGKFTHTCRCPAGAEILPTHAKTSTCAYINTHPQDNQLLRRMIVAHELFSEARFCLIISICSTRAAQETGSGSPIVLSFVITMKIMLLENLAAYGSQI